MIDLDNLVHVVAASSFHETIVHDVGAGSRLTPQVKMLLLYGRIPGPAAEKSACECPAEYHVPEPDRIRAFQAADIMGQLPEAAAVTVVVSRYYD